MVRELQGNRSVTSHRPSEVWQQDPIDPNLWHGPHAVIINTAALHERQAYFSVVLMRHSDPLPLYQPLQHHRERLQPLF